MCVSVDACDGTRGRGVADGGAQNTYDEEDGARDGEEGGGGVGGMEKGEVVWAARVDEGEGGLVDVGDKGVVKREEAEAAGGKVREEGARGRKMPVGGEEPRRGGEVEGFRGSGE